MKLCLETGVQYARACWLHYHFSSTKNGKTRVLTVAPQVIAVLEKQKAKQERWASAAGESWNNVNNLVFTNELGRYVSNKMLYESFKKIAAKIGCEKMRLHDLRHTFAVISLCAGDDIKTVQENLGHATAGFTLSTYAHATKSMKQASASRMDAYIQAIAANCKE